VLLFILSVVAGGRPQEVVFNIIRNINAAVTNSLFTLMAVVAFFYQARVVPSAGHPNALSNWILLHFFTFLVLAISSPFRLILLPNMWQLRSKLTILLEWYPWVGWACVKIFLSLRLAKVVMILLLYSGRIGFDGTIKYTDERRPLINAEERNLYT
jgi:hypothetical protein